MKTTLLSMLLTSISALAAAGCGTESAAVPVAVSPDSNTMPADSFLLEREPKGAVGVISARSSATEDQELVVVGKIGGGINPWIEGRAAFILVDASAAISCDEECADGCSCSAEELSEATTLVKFVDAEGRTLNVDAREFLGVEEAQTVVVRGKAKRDSEGNLTVLANGLFVRR